MWPIKKDRVDICASHTNTVHASKFRHFVIHLDADVEKPPIWYACSINQRLGIIFSSYRFQRKILLRMFMPNRRRFRRSEEREENKVLTLPSSTRKTVWKMIWETWCCVSAFCINPVMFVGKRFQTFTWMLNVMVTQDSVPSFTHSGMFAKHDKEPKTSNQAVIRGNPPGTTGPGRPQRSPVHVVIAYNCFGDIRRPSALLGRWRLTTSVHQANANHPGLERPLTYRKYQPTVILGTKAIGSSRKM